MEAEQPNVIYKQVGLRIKERRRVLRITQSRLAEILDISYQQVQKYETGINQLSLTKLLQFAKALNVSPEYFYEGLTVDSTIGKQVDSDFIQRTRSGPVHILLVEDNLSDALLFSKVAKEFENQVSLHCISDAEQVKGYLGNSPETSGKEATDLVILDLNLPKISGLQLLKEIKTNSQTCPLPVLMLTNSVSKKEMIEAYRLGAAGFIQKSINFEEYRQSIETMIIYWSKVVALPVK